MTSIGFKKNSEWLYAGSEDGTIRIHDLRLSGSQTVYKNDSEINTVILSPSEGEIIAGDQSGRMLIYDLVAGKLKEQLVSKNQKEKEIHQIGLKCNFRTQTETSRSGTSACQTTPDSSP